MVSIGTQPTSLRDRFRRMLGSSRERAAARAELAAQSGRAPLPAPGGVEPGLPYLPPKRPRPITPPPPCQDSSASELEVRQSPAGIFTRLPPELRRAVLVAAFGERKIHVDLRRTQPILPWPDPKAAARSQTLHCRGHTPLSSHVYRNREAPFIPRWWSCVCHHDPCLWDRRLETMWPSPGLSCLSRGYQCIRGDAMACKKWETDEENRCCVGVMGWLLSCRQAYVEGIDVLYSTNTFCIRSRTLFDAWFRPSPSTHHLILPARLASITSLELGWDIMLFGSDPGEMGVPVDHDPTVAATRARFWMQLRYLCQPFPNLRRLLLSFTGLMYNDYSRRPSEALEDMDTVLLRPLAAAVARLPQLRVPVVVELPEAVCRELSSRESIAKLGITVEWYPRTAYQSWIRYPVSTTSGSANGDDSGDIATLTPDVQGNVAGETARENQFYYIVRGDEDSLRWNYLGKPYHPAHHIGNCGI